MTKSSSVKVAVMQAAPDLFDRDATVEKTCQLIGEAAKEGAQFVLFPEAFIPAYPRGLSFGNRLKQRVDIHLGVTNPKTFASIGGNFSAYPTVVTGLMQRVVLAEQRLKACFPSCWKLNPMYFTAGALAERGPGIALFAGVQGFL